MKGLTLSYNGLPIKPKYNGRVFSWIKILKVLYYINNEEFAYIDGWRFSIPYALIYLAESPKWVYYLPPDGVKNKIILSVGGGCGEDAKFFLEHGALGVSIIEANQQCEEHLKYNSIYHPISYKLRKFEPKDIFEHEYDLIKIDIEGYETELLSYLDKFNIDMVIETHSKYITDKFVENGFNYVTYICDDVDIYGGVNILCRWKK